MAKLSKEGCCHRLRGVTVKGFCTVKNGGNCRLDACDFNPVHTKKVRYSEPEARPNGIH